MRILALVTKGTFKEGVEYDLPDKEAQAAIIAGVAVPLVTAKIYEKAVQAKYETRWHSK